jgi:Cys-tRNA(Pro)/Cys-tRNA(Cys) deacylase
MARHGRTPGTDALDQAGVSYTLHAYEVAEKHEGTYGEAVAKALHVDPRRLFKTLLARVDGELVVAVVPVAARLDLKALARAAGGKRAALADVADAQRVTGYVHGGISPFGQRRRLPTFVDGTALAFETIYVSAGRRGLQVEVSPEDLGALLHTTTSSLAGP